MVNDMLNGLVALIEGRPEVANPLLRDVIDRKSRVSVTARLYDALDNRDKEHVTKILRHILQDCLRIESPDGLDPDTFYLGVKAVEDYIEERLKSL